MTDKQLRERCAFWQKVLRLQDWRISVRVVDSEELSAGGDCQVFQHSKLVLVRIKNGNSYDQGSAWHKAFPEHYDLEITLVHELLHIHFDMLIDSEDNEYALAMEEQALEAIAHALVSLERG